jgi:hypothetical protein
MSDEKTLGAALVDRFVWKKVKHPKTWRPKEPGEEIVGYYGGKTLRNGTFGEYHVIVVHVPREGSFMVSGTQIVQLIDAASIREGWPIRIKWGGVLDLPGGKTLKQFEVQVAEGEPIEVEEMPRMAGFGQQQEAT